MVDFLATGLATEFRVSAETSSADRFEIMKSLADPMFRFGGHADTVA
jgi:hypothetical protein